MQESFDYGSEENAVYPNIRLPDEFYPGFREMTSKLYWQLNKASAAILEAIIMSLNLTDSEAALVRSLHTGYNNQLRLLHYPSVSDTTVEDENVSRLGTHRDGRDSIQDLCE